MNQPDPESIEGVKEQLRLEYGFDDPPIDAKSTTFEDNMRIPVHRWFRYSAGFSASWAQHIIEKESQGQRITVLDPFAGSGTTILAAEDAGKAGIGIEAHPFVARVAEAKLLRHTDPIAYRSFANRVIHRASSIKGSSEGHGALIQKCYSPASLAALESIRLALTEAWDSSPSAKLTWLTLVSILRRTSHANTAQWQYVLPSKSKSKVADPMLAFLSAIDLFSADMTCSRKTSGSGELIVGDARLCDGVEYDSVDLVVTSPPYANNYDYADATRLEMTFMKEINGWGDLQESVRAHLIRSCSQHVPERAVDLRATLTEPVLAPIRDEITDVCSQLAQIRLTKGGKKTYHLMVACYFFDLAQVWLALRRCCKLDSKICFVIGDSAPYGIYVPTVDWLGRLAIGAGFSSFYFEQTRERNTKWKNRKHRVPLCEGRLWVEG